MTDENLYELRVKDLLRKINPQFFKWLNKILELNVARTLQLGTFYLNLYILQNYFPSVNFLYEHMPDDFKKTFPPEKLREFRINFERIFTIFIMLNLKYRSNINLSTKLTDEKIGKLESDGILVNS